MTMNSTDAACGLTAALALLLVLFRGLKKSNIEKVTPMKISPMMSTR